MNKLLKVPSWISVPLSMIVPLWLTLKPMLTTKEQAVALTGWAFLTAMYHLLKPIPFALSPLPAPPPIIEQKRRKSHEGD